MQGIQGKTPECISGRFFRRDPRNRDELFECQSIQEAGKSGGAMRQKNTAVLERHRYRIVVFKVDHANLGCTQVSFPGCLHPPIIQEAGVLTILLQLTSEFTDFFERFIRMMEQMTTSLPDLETNVTLFTADGSLHALLVDVYEDILEFCGQATHIFVKKDKSMFWP